MIGRVQHKVTGAQGVATDQKVLNSEFAGDLAGPWSYVRFDDGLRCWVPDARLERPAERGQDGDALYRRAAR